MCAGNRCWDHGICVLVTGREPWCMCVLVRELGGGGGGEIFCF